MAAHKILAQEINLNTPTEDEALAKWGKLTRRRMNNVPPLGSGYPKVYICSPYAGNVQKNTLAARQYCKYAISKHCMPVASHLLYPQFLNDEDPAQREMGLAFGIYLLMECSALWQFGAATAGMKAEIDYALKLRIPVKIIHDPAAFGRKGWNPIAEVDRGSSTTPVDKEVV